jgi:catechol 2,3-dioxygenase
MPALSVGTVSLTVADLDRARDFYERVIGLRTLARDGASVSLGVPGGPPLLELVGDPDAPPRPPRTSGLFHLALLVPERRELARALVRVADAGWRFSGASDHLVSEALYLDDPEGNGIELYRDRPREVWGQNSGEIRMDTLPLDLNLLIAEVPDDADPGMPPGTVMGHVHLNVAELEATEAFYSGRLGLDVMVRSYPGALFLASGGYHHHLGTNVWRGAGVPPPPPGARGLREFSLVFEDAGELAAAGGEGVVTDPSGVQVRLAPQRLA